MADSATALGLIKPEVGASNNTWGGKHNTNMDLLDELITARLTDESPHAAALKGSLTDDDEFVGSDSADSYAFSRWKWSVVKSTLKTYFDQWLYMPGDYKFSAVKAAPSGWLIANGRTIGNASSGSTARANADTATLFAVLWDNFANTELAIQDSSGSASTRGANAAADYAANKRMPLPDLRGRVMAGWDNLASASILSSPNDDTFGAVGGSKDHTLTQAETPLKSHTHGVTDPGHAHVFPYNLISVDGPDGSNPQAAGGGSYPRVNNRSTNSATTGLTVNAASDATATTHNNVQPTFIGNILIKL